MKNMPDLVIVESPTKARTLSKFLGSKYKIDASMGHIRDLPKGELGVDIEHQFVPKYIIPRDKTKKVNELKKSAKGAKIVYLASDPDREGEAIAWHIAYLLGEDKKVKAQIKRVVFHEITEDAIKEAFSHPRDLDLKLVDAQQARRILDRLVGYKLSPILWKKVRRGLSAGRVQTVALRLVVEREREIASFTSEEYWSIDVEVEKNSKEMFLITVFALDFKKLEIKNKEEAQKHLDALEKSNYQVSEVNQKEVRRYPSAPFTTSTLQQTAGNKLGLTAKRTMMLAQNLYEQGLITYMRTDSVNLSTFALNQARDLIVSKFGKDYLPASARVFKSKSKNAQEAHEAIRPTNIKTTADSFRDDQLTRDHKRLYDLIWKRTVASQMSEAILDQTTVVVNAGSNNGTYSLKATGSVLKFDGWLKLYGVKQEVEEENSEDDKERKQVLPQLNEGETLNLLALLPGQHFTEPPPRYTEASLIKKLEELGIGRPSTYAPILSTLQERFYVEKSERKLKPTLLGSTVTDFLVKYFSDIFDYGFTASLEDQLDEISRGERDWKKTLGEFYTPLEGKLEKTLEVAEHVQLPVETVEKECPNCGKQLIVRTGKFGKFLACSGFPDCKHTEPLELKIDVKCPKDQGDVVMRKTKKGKPFYGCKNYPNCDFASWTKPQAGG